MSILRQIVLSLLIVAGVAGGWFLHANRDLFLPAAPGPAGPGSGPGTGGAPPAGGPPGGGPPGAGAGQRGGFGPPLVVAAPVETDSTGVDIRAIGTASAVRSVTVYPQVTGVVASIAFTPGATVAAGQPLVTLDAAEQQVAVERAEVGLDKAREAVARAERLSKSGSVTAVTLADAEVALRQAEIDLKGARLDLDRRTIRAPFAGTVGLTDLAVGDLVSPSKPIATIDDTSTIAVAFTVPERVAGRVAIGEAVTASAEPLPGVDISGTISAVDSRIDPATRTLKVEAALANERGILKPGMAITISLAIAGEPQPTVPSLAIQWDRKGSFVWQLDGDVVRRTPVKVLSRRSGLVVVAGDLAAGDEVVVEGVLRLRDGMTVARTDAPPAAKPPGDGKPAGEGQPVGAAPAKTPSGSG